MRLAAFQMVAKTGDVTANLKMIEAAVAEAKSLGADLLVAPELATTGYGAGDAMLGLAEPASGAQASALAADGGEARYRACCRISRARGRGDLQFGDLRAAGWHTDHLPKVPTLRQLRAQPLQAR